MPAVPQRADSTAPGGGTLLRGRGNMQKKFRFYLGLVCLVLSFVLPLFGFLVAQMNWSIALKTIIIGLLTVGGPELFAILAVILLGKETFIYLKDKFFALLKRLRPPAPVSRIRYKIGLLMFLIPLIPTYIMGYAPHWLPDQSSRRLYVNIAADFIFLFSLFVLGGDFWDKLRALFVYEARVQFDPSPEKNNER
jgi:hypothetical protein